MRNKLLLLVTLLLLFTGCATKKVKEDKVSTYKLGESITAENTSVQIIGAVVIGLSLDFMYWEELYD